MVLDKEKVKRIVKCALDEDIGSGDITTESVIPAGIKSKAVLKAKEDCIICGLDVAAEVFRGLDSAANFKKLVEDGDQVKSGDIIAEITADGRALMSGERTALNFLQRLSGIATQTKKIADQVKDCNIKLLDTRKTTPGLRILEKYAVKCGGGSNHRFGLYDAILIKDNHIKLAGLEESIAKARKTGKKVEIEVTSPDEAERALKAGADIIMLDNMSIGEIDTAVEIIDKRAIIEVSGGVNEENIEGIAKMGVDWVSVGSLTHSVKSKDISMEIERKI